MFLEISSERVSEIAAHWNVKRESFWWKIVIDIVPHVWRLLWSFLFRHAFIIERNIDGHMQHVHTLGKVNPSTQLKNIVICTILADKSNKNVFSYLSMNAYNDDLFFFHRKNTTLPWLPIISLRRLTHSASGTLLRKLDPLTIFK